VRGRQYRSTEVGDIGVSGSLVPPVPPPRVVLALSVILGE